MLVESWRQFLAFENYDQQENNNVWTIANTEWYEINIYQCHCNNFFAILLLFPPELVPPENHFHFSIQFFSLLKTPPSCLTLSETFSKELLSQLFHALLLQQLQKSFICKILSIEKYWSSKYRRGGWMTNLELCSKYWRVLKSIEKY